MKTLLHGYQKRAVDFINKNTHCCLFLEMGLGKSLITLTAISELINDVMIRKVLVVAPRKVAESTWSDEVDKWDTLRHMRVSKAIGTEKQRIRALETDADIYVVSRDSWVWIVKHYNATMPFDMLVIDELTSFKSNTSRRFKAMRLVRSQFDRIIGLTGTPAPNGYLDLWAEMYCVDGGERLGKFVTRYRQKYFNIRTGPQGYILNASLKQGAKKEIDDQIAKIVMTMQARDYLTLPERIDILKKVYLPDSVMKRYRSFERDMVMSISDEASITAANAASLLGKMLQFANGCVYTNDHMAEHIHDEKTDALAEIVEASQSPVLVFYQYKFDIAMISDKLSKTYKVREYTSPEDLQDWNAGKIDVLLAHPGSCAYGLNMQQGGHVIVWFGVGFNLEQYQQACARLHRQGQKHPVKVYHILADNTVDMRSWASINDKAKTQEALMSALKEMVSRYR